VSIVIVINNIIVANPNHLVAIVVDVVHIISVSIVIVLHNIIANSQHLVNIVVDVHIRVDFYCYSDFCCKLLPLSDIVVDAVDVPIRDDFNIISNNIVIHSIVANLDHLVDIVIHMVIANPYHLVDIVVDVVDIHITVEDYHCC